MLNPLESPSLLLDAETILELVWNYVNNVGVVFRRREVSVFIPSLRSEGQCELGDGRRESTRPTGKNYRQKDSSAVSGHVMPPDSSFMDLSRSHKLLSHLVFSFLAVFAVTLLVDGLQMSCVGNLNSVVGRKR